MRGRRRGVCESASMMPVDVTNTHMMPVSRARPLRPTMAGKRRRAEEPDAPRKKRAAAVPPLEEPPSDPQDGGEPVAAAVVRPILRWCRGCKCKTHRVRGYKTPVCDTVTGAQRIEATFAPRGSAFCELCHTLEPVCNNCCAPEEEFVRQQDSSVVCKRCGWVVDINSIDDGPTHEQIEDLNGCFQPTEQPVRMRDEAGGKPEDAICLRFQNTAYVRKDFERVCATVVSEAIREDNRRRAATRADVSPKDINFVDECTVDRVVLQALDVVHHMYVLEMSSGVSRLDTAVAALRYVIKRDGLFDPGRRTGAAARAGIVAADIDAAAARIAKGQVFGEFSAKTTDHIFRRLVATRPVRPHPPKEGTAFALFAGSPINWTGCMEMLETAVRQMVHIACVMKKVSDAGTRQKIEQHTLRVYASLSRLNMFARYDSVVLNAFACLTTVLNIGGYVATTNDLSDRMGICNSWQSRVFGGSEGATRRRCLMECAARIAGATLGHELKGTEMAVVMAPLAALGCAHGALGTGCPRAAIAMSAEVTLGHVIPGARDAIVGAMSLKRDVRNLMTAHAGMADALIEAMGTVSLNTFKLCPSAAEEAAEARLVPA